MRFKQRFLQVFGFLLLVSASAFAQTTGSLTGTVTTDKAPLPGATITVSSPALQGTRTAVSDVNGNFNMPALPPGDYTVKMELAGLQTMTKSGRVTLGGTSRVDGDLKLSSVAEAITVTATAPAVLETTDVQSNMQQKLVNDLPLGRTVTQIALLAPGTTSNGPRGAITISGATSNDNLIMVDGAVIQENLRGQTHGLFIEDAIQETTVTTGAVSAEYGRFTGGVINSISKSGGNQFSGSFRSTFDNPSYGKTNPFPGSVKPIDKLSEVYEATLGGRIIRDRLWFFLAGRKTPPSVTETDFKFAGNGANTFPVTSKAHRYEYKLTGQITPKHSLVGTFLDSPFTQANNCQLGCLDKATLDPLTTQANDFRTGHYNGILTPNLIAELGYSKKKFTFIGFGGDSTDPVVGTPIYGLINGVQFTANAPYFCGICTQETRDNKDYTAKATYFLATKAFGTHNVSVGYDDWAEQRVSNNYQSPTNLVVELYTEAPTRAANGDALVSLIGDPDGGADVIAYYPVLFPSLGSDQKVKSIFLNDKWDLGNHFSFNLGVRNDKNEAVDSAHNKTANDSSVSPRLGV
ncbi:MAG TPA: TonB-dependent receptor, partial [Thermoanaerobaculia bacterium]|nr:TonB-dependent receptor [Thermoanaerobaculia bacterium]